MSQDATDNAVDQRQAEETVRETRRLVEVGLDVEAFMRTPAGLYITAKANNELLEAQEALVEVDANNFGRVRELQLQARVAQRVLTYLGDIVQEGRNAQRAFVALEASGDLTGS
ncbi:MAG TPA: hypothetical protein VIL30_16720 [Ramlibacter sp.]